MKKGIIIGVSIFVLLIVGFISYKCVILSIYNSEKLLKESPNLLEGIKIKDDIVLKHSNNSSNYLTFENISIRDDFKDFSYNSDISEEESKKYVLYDENKSVKTSFWMTITEEYINMLDSSFDSMGNETDKNGSTEIKNLLHKNKVTNDIELINFISEYDFCNHSIFTSTKKIKNDYKLLQSILISFPQMDSITEIKGDYKGYILNINKKIKEISILKNSKRYVFTFISDGYFSDDDIYDLISTIIIN